MSFAPPAPGPTRLARSSCAAHHRGAWLARSGLALLLASAGLASGACGDDAGTDAPDPGDAGVDAGDPPDHDAALDAAPPPPPPCFDLLGYGHATELFGDEGVLRLRSGQPAQVLATIANGARLQLVANEDRSRVAWSIDSQIFHIGIDGTDPVGPLDMGVPVSRLAYSHGRLAVSTATELVVIPEAGGEPVAVATRGFWPSWSADGQQLVFAGAEGGVEGAPLAIHVATPGMTPELVLAAPEVGSLREPQISPDGTRVLYQLFAGSRAEIHVVGIDGTGELALTAMGKLNLGARWSPDGTQVLFQHVKEPGDFLFDYDLWIVPAAGGVPRQLTFSQESGESFDWAPDGSFVTYMRGFNLEAVFTEGGPRHVVSNQNDAWRHAPIALGRCD